MPRKKCVICGEPLLPTDTIIPYKNRSAHEACFEKAVKSMALIKQETLKAKAKTKTTKKISQIALKDSVSEEEYAQKKQYYNYLKDLTDIDLNAKQHTLSDQYITKYGFTFQGMYDTLVYLHDIIHKELTGDIVGLIPYYYDEAQKFNKELQQIQTNNSGHNISEYHQKTVYIKMPQRSKQEIDITEIKE